LFSAVIVYYYASFILGIWNNNKGMFQGG
jgi:hypothetical protein